MRVISDNGPIRLLANKHPRRACAARVTVLESWGHDGGKGEREEGERGKRGRREEGGQSTNSGGKFKFCIYMNGRNVTAPLCMPMVAGDGGTLDPAEHFDSEH